MEIKSLYKNYDDKQVLKGISFSAGRGEIVSLLGSNGSGKTTTFKSILGLLSYEGRIRLDGKVIDKSRIGYMPEERSLFYDCSIHKQVLLMARLKGLKDLEGMAKAEKWYQKTDTLKYKNSLPAVLSKGNQQKIQMIMALINDPDLVILDEPWTGLDQNNIEIFQKILLELKAKNRIVILSSHQHQQVQEICDRYLYLYNGELTINVTRKALLSSNKRVLEAEGSGAFLPDLKGIRKGNRLKLVLNRSYGQKIMNRAFEDPSVTALSFRPLSINDLIELKTC